MDYHIISLRALILMSHTHYEYGALAERHIK